MRSFKLSLCAGVLALATVATVSGTAKAEHAVSVTVRNKYVTREGAMGYDGAVLHTQFVRTAKSGFTLGLWNSMSLSPLAVDANGGDELRLFGGWQFKSKALKLDLGLQYEDRYHLISLKNGDVLTAYAEGSAVIAKADTSDVTPFVRLEGHQPLHAIGERPSFLGVAGLTVHGLLGAESLLGVVVRPAFIYDSGGTKGGDYGMLGSLDLALNWKFSKHVEMNLPELRVLKPIKVHDDRTEQQILGGVLTLSF